MRSGQHPAGSAARENCWWKARLPHRLEAMETEAATGEAVVVARRAQWEVLVG